MHAYSSFSIVFSDLKKGLWAHVSASGRVWECAANLECLAVTQLGHRQIVCAYGQNGLRKQLVHDGKICQCIVLNEQYYNGESILPCMNA